MFCVEVVGTSRGLCLLWNDHYELQIISSSSVPSKIKHFIWRVYDNILPSRATIFKKKIAHSPLCPICCSEPETLEHLFLLCPWTTPLWFGLQFLPPPSSIGLSSIHNWILTCITGFSPSNPNFSSWLFYTLWKIWKTRNDVWFDNKTPNPFETLQRTKSLCLEYINATSVAIKVNPFPTSPMPYLRIIPAKWRPPPSFQVKFNTNVCFDVNTGKGSIGIICRDNKGSYRSS